jgi:hypothetical protein
MNWYPAACPICNGDLHDDLDDVGWLMCFACARTFPTSDPRFPFHAPPRGSAFGDTSGRQSNVRPLISHRATQEQPRAY